MGGLPIGDTAFLGHSVKESTKQVTRLWTSAQPVVAAFVASIVIDHLDHDDVMPETALAVVNSFASYDPSRSFQGWAIGIARNQIGLYLRRRKRDRLVFSEETIATLQSTFDEKVPPKGLDFLPECMDQLEGHARTLCDFRFQYGLKPSAIGDKVGMTANNVAKALQRIREQLRICIEGKIAREEVIQ